MSEWQVRPEAVDRAVAWLRENDARFTEDALVSALREQGYAEAEIAAALARRRGELPMPPVGADLRGRAAVILIVVFLAVWVVISLALVTGPPNPYLYGGEQMASLILGALLLPVMLLGLVIISESGRLKRGVEGALVAILALPFVLLVIVAGACVITTNPFA